MTALPAYFMRAILSKLHDQNPITLVFKLHSPYMSTIYHSNEHESSYIKKADKIEI